MSSTGAWQRRAPGRQPGTATGGTQDEARIPQGSLPRTAQGPLLRRDADRRGLAEDGRGGPFRGPAQGVQRPSAADRGARPPAREDLPEPPGEPEGTYLRGDEGPAQGRGGDGQDEGGALGDRRRPDRLRAAGGALRDRRLRHGAHLRRDARQGRPRHAPRAHAPGGGGDRRAPDRARREPHQPGSAGPLTGGSGAGIASAPPAGAFASLGGRRGLYSVFSASDAPS